MIGIERTPACPAVTGAPLVARAALPLCVVLALVLALALVLVLMLEPRLARAGGGGATALDAARNAVPAGAAQPVISTRQAVAAPAAAAAGNAVAAALPPHGGRTAAASSRRSQVLARAIFRVLAFDRHLDQRCKYGAVRVVIVRGEQGVSQREAKALARALEAARGTTIAGLPYEYQIADRVPRNESYEVIFLPSGLPRAVVREAVDDARERGVLCLTTDVGYLRRGAAVAILVGSDRPEIVIQRDRAIEQGAEFDPRLYAYSSVISD